jgi:hypothetical protein
MPRQARTVFAGVPHHITQRGNRREDVFYTNEDRETYLGWLNEYCQLHKKGLPCGSDRFIQKLEKKIGRMLNYRPLVRPRKPIDS